MISALVIPEFAVAIERKLNPTLYHTPVVIASEHTRSKVIAMCYQARQDGVEVGKTIRHAEVLCPDIEVVPVNRLTYQRWSQELAEVLLRYSHKVEIEYQPTTTAFYVNTHDLLPEMQSAIASYLGLIPGIGMASNKFTARVAGAYATKTKPYALTIPEGKESDYLAQYPVNVLPLDKEMTRRLPLLGIETIGQFARLPKGSVLEQFGKFGRRIHDLANGQDIRPIASYTPPEFLSESFTLEVAIGNYQAVETILQRLAQALILRLQSRKAHQLNLMLTLENRQTTEQAIQPPDPIGDYQAIINHAHALLHRQPITSKVMGIEIQLHDLYHSQPKQLSLFDAFENKQSLNQALPRLQKRHQSTDFLEVTLEPTPVYYIPEYQFRYRVVGV